MITCCSASQHAVTCSAAWTNLIIIAWGSDHPFCLLVRVILQAALAQARAEQFFATHSCTTHESGPAVAEAEGDLAPGGHSKSPGVRLPSARDARDTYEKRLQ